MPPSQLALALPPPAPGHGGRRPGAGRKPTRRGSFVAHTARPFHDRHHPLHVTLRVQRRLANLRRFKLAAAIGKALRADATETGARRLDRFRVVQFSIQHDHLHLIVEASTKVALGRGMKALTCRVAKAVNRALRRSGPVFADRYHARELATPREVRNALRYVLLNAIKHAEADPFPDLGTAVDDGIDPCSSARWFDGWKRPPPRELDPPCAPARAWLLRIGWKRHGLLVRDECPSSD